MIQNFNEFVDRKDREANQHLKIIKKVFEKSRMEVVDKLDDRNDPYIFVRNPDNNLSFEGVRVYQIGNVIAFRIQKEADTHPYGTAYPLNVEQMFEDLIGEEKDDDEKVGHQIVKAIVSEVKDFFTKSFEAERDAPPDRFDPLSRVVMRNTGPTDYGSGAGFDNRRDATI